MEIGEILEIDKKNKQRFSSQKDYYDFLMFHLQSHMIEIDDLKQGRNPHYVKEIVDLAILAKLLALSEGADDSVFQERYKRFEEKIMEGIN